MFDLHTSTQDAPGRAPGAAPERGAVQRERAERALRESEACFRSIVEGLSEGVLVTDLRDIVVYANPQVQRIYGYAPEELLGRRTYEVLVVAEERDQLRRRVTERARGISERYEARHLRKDGSRVWVEIGGVPLRNATGEIVGTVGTITDITARKQTELRLREAEERFRQFAENVDQVFWIRSVDPLRSVYVSPAYERIWGRSCRSLREESGSFLDAIHPDDRERVGTAIHGENASAFEEEYRVIRPDGSVRWVRDRAFPVRNAAGEVYRIAGIAEDITARKLATEALRESEEQLRQAQKMEAVGRLAGGIAHDFNNMLTAIKGNAQLLLMDLQPGAPMRDDLEEIDQAATRAASLTRQLLAFSRRQVLQPEILDLNAHVAEMEKMLCRVIGEDVELRTRLHPAPARVRADPGQIEQVILNLAVNARDAMPRGGKLTIETANVELDAAYARGHHSTVPGPYVMLAVSDTGCGMDREVRERIWEPFFTTKPQGQGTGLGLSTVYGIVQQSGGSIWVYSEPGHGTVFKVYLPREDPETRAPHPEAISSSTGRGSGTVLLVEDEEMVRNLALRILGRGGYTVLEAHDTEEAIRICRTHPEPIDLLLTDVVMPRMSGPELTEQLRPMRPGMRILYMSGYTDEAVVHHGVLDVNTAFIQKPFTPEALTVKVRETLDTRER